VGVNAASPATVHNRVGAGVPAVAVSRGGGGAYNKRVMSEGIRYRRCQVMTGRDECRVSRPGHQRSRNKSVCGLRHPWTCGEGPQVMSASYPATALSATFTATNQP